MEFLLTSPPVTPGTINLKFSITLIPLHLAACTPLGRDGSDESRPFGLRRQGGPLGQVPQLRPVRPRKPKVFA